MAATRRLTTNLSLKATCAKSRAVRSISTLGGRSMRIVLSFLASSVVLGGCAISGTGTEESIAFSPAGADLVEWVSVYKPYEDLAFTIKFLCPGKVYSAMISPVIPLPPVVPVGFINRTESFVHVVFPESEPSPTQTTRITLANGKQLQFQSTSVFGQPYKSESGVLTTYQFKTDCSEFDGGEIQIEGFKSHGKLYPPVKAKLQFKSKLKVDGGYWRS